MKKQLVSILLILMGWSSFAQKGAPPETYQLSFADSIRVLLNNTKSQEAMAVGDAFGILWINLGPDHQATIQRQANWMKKKGYKLRPHFANYYGAIVAAINTEKADASKFSGFLSVVDKVIANQNSNLANVFFQQSRDFFEHHAITYQKSFQLRATDDDYSFSFLEKAIATDISQDFVPPAEPDTAMAILPNWRQPIVQPEVLGAAIVFSRVSLVFITPYDSAVLKNTRGIYALQSKLFVGEGGNFDWTAAGLAADSVNYELNKYNFNTTKPSLKAEQGKLLYMGKLPGRVPGQFAFNSINHKTKKASIYPRFRSYENNVNILGLGQNIKYAGGFGLVGSNINSNSVNNDLATLEVMGEADKRFRAQSLSFGFRDSVVLANSARVVIYQGNDSLIHPSMQMRYDFRKQKMTLTKDNSQLRKAPFSSSFFGVDLNPDAIRWDLISDSLTLAVNGNGNVSPLVIESNDYYQLEDYEQLRGQGFNFHPLAVVVQYAKTFNTQDFTVFDLVTANRKLEQMKMAADLLSQKGMIFYDARTGKIHVKDKAMHMINALKGNADYDNMKIHSLADTVANAIINLKGRNMVVHGVEEFNVSDSLNVIIKPDSSVITLLQNRNIKFNGSITAGNFEICGKDFMFNYEGFFVDLNHIDSIRFYVTGKDGSRRRMNNTMMVADSVAIASIDLKSNATKTSGKLFINRPDNKSGRDKELNFPRLSATEGGGVIYFDRQEILDGAYDKSVFFVMPNFSLDSLDDANPNSMNFDGTFVSSGMFPNFKEKIRTIGGGSMGLTHQVPQGGYRLFRSDAKLQGNIKLDNEGIRANGKIEYMAAEVKSNDFVFYVDSVLAKGNEAVIREKQIGSVRFPQMKVSDYQMKWFPKQDRFRMKNLKEPFAFYNNSASLNGIVTVTKTGTYGSGKLTTRGSIVSSREFNFNSNDFGARHARFEVKTGNPDKPALAGNDINIKFDLDRNFVNISPEVEGVAAFEFPFTEFKTSIPNARWDLSTQKIVMTKADVPLENSYFYTTRKELDSLHFNAEKAEYDIQKQELKVSGIPFMVVADAKITPENNQVLILENAKIGQLKNTTIVLDTLNGYHLLTNGVVDIISRKEFSGYATYKYINAANDTFDIKMTDFHLEPIVHEGRKSQHKGAAAQQTVGNGAVTDTEKIQVAPRIFFKGDITMYATRPALQLKGFVKLDLKKIKNYNTWLSYNQSGDEKDIYLDFDKATTEEGRRAMAGLHFAQDNSLYTTFLYDKKDEGDDDFFLPSGSLFFDKESGQFKIEDRKKAAGEKLEGKVFAYNEDKQEINFEGPVKFFRENKSFSLLSSVIGSGNLVSNDIKMNALIQADMNIPPTAYQVMALNLEEVIKNEGAAEGLGDQTELLYKMANLVGERITKDYETRAQQGYVSLATVPGMIKPIVFSNVNLKWSQDRKAFFSEGQLGISNMARIDINGSFEGFMEIRKNEDGAPVFHVFFKASPEAWYYFGFEDNRLMVHSSNAAFNDIITKKTNASKAKIGELAFIPGSDDETLAFVNRFRLTYYGIEAPYDLSGGTSSAIKKDKKKEEKKEDDGF